MDDQTARHLRLLATFHYVLAAVAAFASLLPALYIGMGVAVLSGALPVPRGGTPPPPGLAWFFVGLGAALMLLGLAYVVLLVVAGRSLARTRRWTFCLVVAALSCAFFPFGTVLGVFTIVVLVKPEVKAAFEVGPPAARPPPYAAGA